MARQTREDLGVQLTDTIVLKGKVTYCRIARKIEGEELERQNKEKEAKGMYPSTRPYYALTLEDVEIVRGQGTPLAQYHGQEVYTNKAGKNAISLTSIGTYPPTVMHKGVGQAEPQAITLEKDLATGQEVEVLMNVFTSNQYKKLSSSFKAILLPEGEIRYYEGNANASVLAGFGLESAPAPAGVDLAPEIPSAPVAPATPAPAESNPFASVEPAAPAQTNVNPFG